MSDYHNSSYGGSFAFSGFQGWAAPKRKRQIGKIKPTPTEDEAVAEEEETSLIKGKISISL